MRKLWGRAVAGIVLISFAALVLWPLAGPTRALMIYSALLLALLLHHALNLSRLHDWLSESAAKPLPDGAGPWEDIFAGLSRLLRRQTHIETRLSNALSRFERPARSAPVPPSVKSFP